MNASFKLLNSIDIDRVAGGVALPPEPTIEDFIDLAKEAEEITLWRLTR